MQTPFHNESDCQKGGRKLVMRQRQASPVMEKRHSGILLADREEALCQLAAFADEGKNEGQFKS